MGIMKREDIALLTIPGVVLYQLVYMLLCKVVGLKVERVYYFDHDYPAGEVRHGDASALQGLIVFLVPFLLLNYLAIWLFRLSFGSSTLVMVVLIWLAASIAIQSFPDTGVLKKMEQTVNNSRKGAVVAPFYMVFKTTHVISFLGGYFVWALLLYFWSGGVL